MAAEADSVRMLQIWQDVTIGEVDSQLIKPSELCLGFYLDLLVLESYKINIYISGVGPNHPALELSDSHLLLLV